LHILTQSTFVVAVNTLYAIPIKLLHVTDVQAIGVQVSTLSAGNCRVGLYADNAGIPGILIQDVGVVATGTTGAKWQAMVRTLQPGMYWAVCIFDATPTMRAQTTTFAGPGMLGWLSGTDTAKKAGWSVAQAYGALPDPFTGGGALVQQVPIVCLWISRSQYAYGEFDADLSRWQVARYSPVLDIPYSFVSGRYYESPLALSSTITSTLYVTKDILYAVPFYVGASTTFTEIGIEVTTLVALSNVRLGIYNMGAGVPGSLVLDAGAVGTAAVAYSAIAINQVLTPGWYWLGGVFSHTPYVRAKATTQVHEGLGLTTNEDVTSHPGWSVAQAYGALPDPFTGGGALMTGSAPRFMLKV
jgi:hypothetical protein